MLIPKRNAKSYGVLHLDSFLTFIGFYKSINDDEIYDIHILLDDKIIQTIKCNKNVEIIEKLYEIKGHCFEYVLPEDYFEQEHMISFKGEIDNVELQNSPIKTISKRHKNYKKYSEFQNFILSHEQTEIG